MLEGRKERFLDFSDINVREENAKNYQAQQDELYRVLGYDKPFDDRNYIFQLED